MNQIRKNFDACNFIIEGDIESCFPSINHDILISILRKRIADHRFFNLIRNFLVEGYLVNTPGKKSFISFPELGTSQGSIISTILCNIYIDSVI
jgi:retron-type reverse transcriptase